MQNFIKNPNLPAGECKQAAIGEKYADILQNALHFLGISVIPVSKNANVDERLAYHADLSLFHAGEQNLVLAQNICSIAFEDSGFTTHTALLPQDAKFPGDVTLNACRLGKYLIHDQRYTDPKITAILKEHVLPIHVKQAYSKCAVCIVDEQHIITADKGIANAAALNGIEVLMIRPGYFELDGFDTGFIGGCCGKIAKDRIAFTGHLKAHLDQERILSYLDKLGVKAEYLHDRPAFDIGSILPLKEA